MVRLEAETAKYKRGMDRANRQLDRFKRRQSRTLDQIRFAFVRIAGPAAIGALIIQAGRLSDRFNQLSVRIRTATRETGDFARVQRTLIGIAVDTGASLETAVDTFQAFSRVRDDIGATNDQVLTLTRTLNQLGVIGGTSTEAMRNGLRQFNQGIAAGVFRAEEFNSIVENVPELAARIAAGFGKTQGELRKMVLAGELFSRDVVNVLLGQAPEIAAQFGEIPNNLDRAFNALETSIGASLSALDQATGTTASLANSLQTLADAIAVASGTATPEQQLQDQLRALVSQYTTLTRVVAETNGRNQQAVERMAELALQIAGTTDALAFFRGELDKVTKLSDKAVTNFTALDAALDKIFEDEKNGIFDFGGTARLSGVGLQANIAALKASTSLGIANLEQGFADGIQSPRLDAAEQNFERFSDQLQAISNRAAENIQDAFADFLFDPFEDGLKGMLRSFIDTIRRMAANQAAVAIFGALGFQAGGGGSGGSSTTGFAGSFQSGGIVPGPRGAPQLALVHGGETIIPAGGGGAGVVVNQQLTLNGGADPGQMSQFAEMIRSQTRADIADLQRRNLL